MTPAGAGAVDPGVSPPLTPPEAASAVFGERLPLAERFVHLLATEGIVRGLIGPREAPRLWERHVLNSAVVAELIPPGARVIDVGSGAGLPGVPLALARPDLSVVLVEPMARRTGFLTELLAALSLGDRVEILRARAEECPGRLQPARVAVVRALAPLDRLARWCLPLVAVGGTVLALKGSSVAVEIDAHGAAVRRLGGGRPVLRRCGGALLDPATTVLEITRHR